MHPRLPWVLLAAAFLALAVFIGFDLQAERARTSQAARDQLAKIAHASADSLVHEIRGINQVLETARDELPRLAGAQAGPEAASAVLRMVAASVQGIDALLVVSPDGRVIAGNQPTLAGADLRNDIRYRSLDIRGGARTLHVSPPFDGGIGHAAISLGRLRFDREGNRDGLILATFDASNLNDLLKALVDTPDMRVGLADAAGIIISRYPDPEAAAGKPWGPAFDALAQSVLASDARDGIIEAGDTGFMPDRLVAYRRIDLSDLPVNRTLFAFASRGTDEIFAGWWRDLVRRVARLGVFAAFAVAGLWLLQRRHQAVRDLQATLESERMAADLAFRKNAERMRLAFDSAHLGLWHWDLRDERIEVSANGLVHLGLPAGTTVSYETCLLAIHADDRERVARTIAWSLEHRAEFRADYRVVWPDGTVRWLHAMGRAFDGPDGKPERMETVTLDITERKAVEADLLDSRRKLEERRRQVELLNVQLESRAVDAEAASRAKDAFLRNMSHELRTPLNHISGGAEILMLGSPDDEQRGWIRTIQVAARDLLRMVSEILDVARAQSGQLTLNRVEFSPSAVVEEVRLMLSHRAETKGLALLLEAGSDVPARLVGDPTRLAQALLAYLDNAIKFTQEGSIAMSVQRVAADDRAVTLRFAVRDTGVGIAPDFARKLFKPFTQLDDTLTRAYGGAGIGLSAVLEIAKRMGGTVGVDSLPGEGSTFWFTATFGRPAEVPAATGADRAWERTTPEASPAPCEATPRDRTAARIALAGIEEMLRDSDFRAYGMLEDNARVLAAVFRDDYLKLRHQVEMFDFGRALETARALRATAEA